MTADPFDTSQFPYGKRAGDNKFNAGQCPTCQKPPTHPTLEEYPWPSKPPVEGFYMFKDRLSAEEYYISAMCQSCQDSVFACDPLDAEDATEYEMEEL